MRTTSAPRSASTMAACGPGPIPASSTTRRPARGPVGVVISPTSTLRAARGSSRWPGRRPRTWSAGRSGCRCRACGAPAWSSAARRRRRAGGRARWRRRSGSAPSASAPISASQASGTVANASLTSKAPISSSERPLRCSAFAVAGIGAVSMMTGSSPASTAVWTRAIGVRPSSRGLLAGGHQQGGGAVGDLAGVAGGDHAVAALNAVLQRAQRLHGAAAPDTLVAAPTTPAVGRSPAAIWPSKRPASWAAAAFSCEARRVLVELGAASGPSARRSSRRRRPGSGMTSP